MGPPLARSWGARIPGLHVGPEPGGSGVNVEAVESGRADVAFTQADIAYQAYSRGTSTSPAPHTALRGIAVLWVNTVHVAVRRESPIQSVADLRGKRVSVSARGSGTETLARAVLEAYGFDYADIVPQFIPFVSAVAQVRDGRTDAAFVVAGVPAVAVTELSELPGIRLLPVPREQLTRMRAQYPFLQPLVVPGGTYPHVEHDVETLGVNNLLVCRRDLDEHLVYELTRALFDSLPALEAAHAAARLIDREQAPATPIPLHPGAARYYREREITR